MSAGPLALVHLDPDFLVVDKPAGLLAVPGRGADKQDCLSARVLAAWPDARVVHRLDEATSGLIVFARSALAQRLRGLPGSRSSLRMSCIRQMVQTVVCSTRKSRRFGCFWKGRHWVHFPRRFNRWTASTSFQNSSRPHFLGHRWLKRFLKKA